MITIVYWLSFTGLSAAREAQSNRDYFLRQMSDEICEIIRGLQLTSSDDTEYLGDHTDLQLIVRNSKFAVEWLSNPCVSKIDPLNSCRSLLLINEFYFSSLQANPNGVDFIQDILDTARHFEAFCMSDSERMGLNGLIGGINSRVQQILDALQRVIVVLFLISNHFLILKFIVVFDISTLPIRTLPNLS